MLDDLFSLGRKADHKSGAVRLELRQRGENVRILDKHQRRCLLARMLLELLIGIARYAPVGDGRSADRDIGR